VKGPFIAMGMLMTFMAAAVFAVSSTSRSTQVATNGSVARQLNVIRTSSFRENSLIIVERELCDASDSETVSSEPGVTSRLQTVRICAADNGQEWQEEPLDCRCHYDATYDRAVYGAADADLWPARIEERSGQGTVLSSEEMVAIFRSVSAKQRKPATVSAAAGKPDMVRPVTWNEYASFVPLKPVHIVSVGGPGGSSELSVRSGDWLRHSAALALNRMGGLFQAAATAVEATGCR
jgi:hypothetical protein